MSLLASADAGVVLADQYGLTLPEAGHASAEATRAIIDSLSAQATRPQAHTTAADPIRSTGNPPAATRAAVSNPSASARPPNVSTREPITGWADPAKAQPPADETITTIFIVCPGL